MYRLEKSVQQAVGVLFDEVDKFVDADAGEKSPEVYERFYDDVQYSIMDKRNVGINISTWKSELCGLSVGDIKLKLLDEIKKFCDGKILVIKSPVRPEQREAARKYLKSLGASDDEANSYTDSYAKLSRFTLRKRDFLFTFDHTGIGKYLASHKKEVDAQKRTKIKVFEATVNELIKAYQQLVPIEEEKSLIDKIKEDLMPINKYIRKDWQDWKFNLFWDRLYEDSDMRVALEVVSPNTFEGRYNMKLVIGILSWMASVQKDRIIETTKTKLDEDLYGTETHKTYFSLTKNSIDDYKATIKRILAEIDKIKDKK